jgi:hypothetical protein
MYDFSPEVSLSQVTKPIGLRSVNAILDNLTYLSPNRNLLYVTDASVNPDGKIIPTHMFEHLTCFLPGMLPLGAAHAFVDCARTRKHMIDTLCGFAHSPSPDEVVMNAKSASSEASSLDGLWATHLALWERSGGHGDPLVCDRWNRCRKSTCGTTVQKSQSIFCVQRWWKASICFWRSTGDVVWRERGWAVFEASRTWRMLRAAVCALNVTFPSSRTARVRSNPLPYGTHRSSGCSGTRAPDSSAAITCVHQGSPSLFPMSHRLQGMFLACTIVI